ncbi:MAG: hypothetical protein ACXWWD_07095, partial [Chitinophagaceae bacterium]
GKVDLKEETNFEKSKIFPHLEELNIDKEIEFYAASKKPAAPVAETKIAAVNKKEEKKQTTEPDLAKASPQRSSTTIVPEPNRDAGNSSTDIKKQEAIVKKDEPTPVLEDAVAFTGVKKSALPASNIQAEPKKNVTGDIVKPKIKNQGPGVKINEPIPAIPEATTGIKKQDPATIAKANEEKKVITRDLPQPEFKMLSAAAFVEKRKTVPPQILEFKSDSLELKLYDNGEIDGDTVSILLNGEIVLAKQGLKASAIKKTIYIPPGTDELTLVLYAENLGKYPPNTGLLVVHDGEDVYQVRFSADLQQNASVVFRRKK